MIIPVRSTYYLYMDRPLTSYTPLLLSLLLGAFYTLAIGFGNFPTHLQMTLFWIGFVGSTVILLREKKLALTKFPAALLLLGAGIAGFAAITTNRLLVAVNGLSLFFTASYILLGLFRQSGFPAQATDYFWNLVKFGLVSIYEFIFNLILLKPLALFKHLGFSKWTIKRETAVGFIMAFPILVAFHILFVLINKDYYLFTNEILNKMCEFIEYILDIDLIVFLIKTLITSYTFYILFTTREPASALTSIQVQPALKKFVVILTTTIGLFALFSFFQSKLLFTNLTQLAFKTLSLYTQHGFWELILVSIIGYVLCLWVIGKIQSAADDAKRLRQLLTIFTAELILITIFTYHKLYWLQIIFGLKDQRILATAAVVLITLTFILFLMRIFKRIEPKRIFSIQAVTFLTVVLTLNLMNMDLVVTKTYPISYYVDGAKYKDYSYLLGNSYDNSDEWLNLVREYESIHPPAPQEYYWGWYEPICEMGWTDKWRNTLIVSRESITYLEKHYRYVEEKYNKRQTDLTHITQFNLHEYEAYKLLNQHRQEFDEFLKQVKQGCEKTVER